MSKKENNQTNQNRLEELLEILISLQGRQMFPTEKLCEIVIEKKQNPENYINAYNACDGEHSVTELANIASVKQPTMTPILQNWEELGIIFKVKGTGGKFYKNLYPIKLPKTKQKTKHNGMSSETISENISSETETQMNDDNMNKKMVKTLGDENNE